MDIQFGNLTNLNLLWIVAALIGLMAFAAVLRRRALKRFATSNLVSHLTSGISGPRRIIKAALIVMSLVLLCVALTDPRWGKSWREVPQKGIDVMFVVDVSRSMLAEDATPSRLERARQQIGDMVDAMHGDRVGLVAFAGDVKQLSPLTTNYHDFKQTLATIGPHSVPRGGSKLGDALEVAAKGFLDQTDDHKAIVVFTDGDDQDSDPIDIAKQIHADRGIRIFTVGLGDSEQGARIPVARSRAGTQWLEHEGKQVWSKMNGNVLQQIAKVADGAWIPAQTKQVDMAGVYRSYIANIEQADFETARIHSYIPRHQWLIGLALLLLVLESLISDRRRRTANSDQRLQLNENSTSTGSIKAKGRHSKGSPGKLVASALLIGLLNLGAASDAHAEDASTLVADANSAVTEGDYQAAIADYRRAAELKPGKWEPIYDEAVAHYRNGDLQAARDLFTQTLSSGDRQLETRARFNLANCDYAEAVASAEQDRDAAISKLESAISHYRGALAGDNADADARVNIELASRLINQLRQEQKQEEEQKEQQKEQDQQQQQQQQQQQDQQDQQQQSEQNQDSQQQDQQDQSQQDQESSESKDQKSSHQDSDQSESEQQDENESSEEQQDKSQESQDAQSEKSQSDQMKEQQQDAKPQDEQQDASESDQQESKEQSQSEKQEQQQEQSGDKPEQSEQQQAEQQQPGEDAPQEEQQTGQEPKQEQDQASGGSPQQPSDEQPSGVPQYGASTGANGEPQAMTEIEADKMLQSVRDRDLRRRLEQLRAERQRFVPVDKDW